MKAGTTWLSYNLGNHPQVFIPRQELHFFNDDRIFKKGLQWYEKQFREAGDATAIGEKTAGYLLAQKAPERIAEALPNSKILIVIRNPVDRAISQINHHVRYDLVGANLDPEDFFESGTFSSMDKEFAILERGKYLEQIKLYYDLFDAKNVSVLINELDIRKTPDETLIRVCDFLDIDSGFNFPQKEKRIHENRNSKFGTVLSSNFRFLKPIIAKVDRLIPGAKVPPFKPSKSEAQKIYDYYRSENQRLFDFLGLQIPSSWAEGYQ